MEKVLYEDKWCELTPDCLRIKCYYFPTGVCKEIDTARIEGVYYAAQNLSQCLKVKQWGMALSPCWWACDLLRGCHSSSGPVYYNVVIDCGETLYKGFTVIDICDLLSQLGAVAEQALFD
ncbi:unnamed protein product [Cylicocyclus nassatus]|uniref:Uncharacterized protein n=1 Tax=Cylicocyclus nassatus TaxID=53992 RepID=A0AA36DQI8_CYLNA|nr:unnamed protein product [Cylicocyclus nassatus]